MKRERAAGITAAPCRPPCPTALAGSGAQLLRLGCYYVKLKRGVTSVENPSIAREGLTLGLIVGTAIWLWLVIIDAVAGQPFRTFHVLGGILTFFMLSRTHPLLEEFK